MSQSQIDERKEWVRRIGGMYRDRTDRVRRLFVEERCCALRGHRDKEYEIRRDISQFFGIDYSAICFAGSAQLGFSICNNSIFRAGCSDLDVACVDVGIYQKAWIDVVGSTRAFTDDTVFPSGVDIALFRDRILRRGMIIVDEMPNSKIRNEWQKFEGELSRKHTRIFSRISISLYMNEYAFCWKQDSVVSQLFSGV